MTSANRDHALVLGGSITGMLAARVLADEYAAVTIVERDRLPAGAEHRRGISHGHHVHGMLPKGLQILEELLPGFTERVRSAGGIGGDLLGNVRWILQGRTLRRAHIGLPVLSAGRPLLEGAIRERVRALPNVTVLDGHDVAGIVAGPGGERIIGAIVIGGSTRTLPADLVIDATGRGSRAPRWLADLGYRPPQADRVGIDLSYSSCLFDAPDDILGDDLIVATARFPGQRQSSVMQRIESGRVLVTLAGVQGVRPPTHLDEFPDYARQLATPDTAHVLRGSTPAAEPIRFRYPTYVRHRYEALDRFPAGFLVAGDATCGFNPVYGQGMSVAAMNAVALRDELRRRDEPDPTRYFSAVGRALEAPWRLAVGADLSLPGIEGPVLPESPLTPDYVGRLQLAATEDAVLAEALVRVNGLIDPPPALLRPEIVERVGAPLAGVARSRP